MTDRWALGSLEPPLPAAEDGARPGTTVVTGGAPAPGHRAAVDAPVVHLADDRAVGLEGALRRPVGPEHAGLPARHLALVLEQEVEDRLDVRLAVHEPQAVRQLLRLVDLRAGRDVGDRAGPVLGLGVVRRRLRGRNRRLVAGLEVPDRQPVVGDALSGAAEGLPHHLDQPAGVADRDQGRVLVAHRGVLVRAARVRVVPERVEDGAGAAARPVGGAELADEPGRRVRDVRVGVRVVVARVRVHRPHDVDARPDTVQDVVAVGGELEVGLAATRSRRWRRTGATRRSRRSARSR